MYSRKPKHMPAAACVMLPKFTSRFGLKTHMTTSTRSYYKVGTKIPDNMPKLSKQGCADEGSQMDYAEHKTILSMEDRW